MLMNSMNMMKRKIQYLCDSVSIKDPIFVEKLFGGRNNSVFLIKDSNGTKKVAKFFAQNRTINYKREKLFLEHCQKHNLDCVPKLFASNNQDKSILVEYIEGNKISNQHICEKFIADAAQFIIDLNSSHRFFGNYYTASDACFSIKEMVTSIDYRHNLMHQDQDNLKKLSSKADIDFHEYENMWTNLKRKLQTNFDQFKIIRMTPREIRIYSPSDFGPHNMLINSRGQLKFLDFEYAGYDDPLKLSLDFFSMPDTPISHTYFDLFWSRICPDQKFYDLSYNEISLLLQIFRYKWLCITIQTGLKIIKKSVSNTINILNDSSISEQVDKIRLISSQIKFS